MLRRNPAPSNRTFVQADPPGHCRSYTGPAVMASAARIVCGACVVLVCCGESDSTPSEPPSRTPLPAPEVTLTTEEKGVWSKLPPDSSAIPVLVYHGIGSERDFADPSDAEYGVDVDDFAKQMTLMEHAGYRAVGLQTFLDFVQGRKVDLPARPLLLTFDDARADSWTGADGILRKLGYRAVMFVDVGRVDVGDPEYLTWAELDTIAAGGRWRLELHSGKGHEQIHYGPGPDDYGPFYAYKRQGEDFDAWQERTRQTSNGDSDCWPSTCRRTGRSRSRRRTATTARRAQTTRASPPTCSAG
jgi:hypothetical protein